MLNIGYISTDEYEAKHRYRCTKWFAILSEFSKTDENIMTLEDPEKNMKIIYSNVHRAAKHFGFAMTVHMHRNVVYIVKTE